jgi:hypothetical protein
MTMQVPDEAALRRRATWLQDVERLLTEIEDWCHELNWPAQRERITITEERLGTYDAPQVHARLPGGGELYVTPVALDVIASNGRIDIEAWPSLNRVRLVRRPDAWEIMTDSNVPIRQAWARDTFRSIAIDLARSS